MHSLLAYFMLAAAALAADGPPNADALKRLVHQDCGSCHGITLKGGLGPDIRPASLAHYTNQGLAAVILDGIPDTPMPPWRPLISETEAEWIAAYLLEGDAS